MRGAPGDEKVAAKNSTSVSEPESATDLEEWVFTISASTGEIAKIEKIDKFSGKRHELSTEEYDAISLMMSPSAASYAAYGYDPAQYSTHESSARQEVQYANDSRETDQSQKR